MICTGHAAPGEVLDLAILGVVSHGGLPVDAIVRVVKRIGGPRFRPTADVVSARVGMLIGSGCLVPPAEGEEAAGLRLSEAGRAGIQRLLRRARGAPAEGLGAVCQTLSICLLELLPPDLRDEVLDEAIAANRRELIAARLALERCPCRCRFVEICLARDVERWEAELAWLETLAQDLGPRAARAPGWPA